VFTTHVAPMLSLCVAREHTKRIVNSYIEVQTKANYLLRSEKIMFARTVITARIRTNACSYSSTPFGIQHYIDVSGQFDAPITLLLLTVRTQGPLEGPQGRSG
jgi:hypothetical protein